MTTQELVYEFYEGIYKEGDTFTSEAGEMLCWLDNYNPFEVVLDDRLEWRFI